MEPKKKNIIAIVASFLGSATTILVAAWVLGKPIFDREVKRNFIEELNGPAVELFFEGKAKIKEEEYRQKIKENSEKSFRVLCGEKLGVPFDESHIEIGNLKKRIEGLEKQVDKLKGCCSSRGRNQLMRQ